MSNKALYGSKPVSEYSNDEFEDLNVRHQDFKKDLKEIQSKKKKNNISEKENEITSESKTVIQSNCEIFEKKEKVSTKSSEVQTEVIEQCYQGTQTDFFDTASKESIDLSKEVIEIQLHIDEAGALQN